MTYLQIEDQYCFCNIEPRVRVFLSTANVSNGDELERIAKKNLKTEKDDIYWHSKLEFCERVPVHSDYLAYFANYRLNEEYTEGLDFLVVLIPFMAEDGTTVLKKHAVPVGADKVVEKKTQDFYTENGYFNVIDKVNKAMSKKTDWANIGTVFAHDCKEVSDDLPLALLKFSDYQLAQIVEWFRTKIDIN